MNNEKISGMGVIHAGEYDTINVDGMGKLKGSVKAGKIIVSGALKSKGRITAGELRIDGFARCYRDIRAKEVVNKGTTKIRRAKLQADFVQNEGLLTSTREISADEVIINGYCSVKKIFGDQITIISDFNLVHSYVKKLHWLFYLYFGRHINMSYCLVDQLECTHLTATNLKARLVRAGSVQLRNCRIKRLYCDDEPQLDPSCRIGRIYVRNGEAGYKRREDTMGTMSVKKILKLYKSGTIEEEEAELMLKAVLGSREREECVEITETKENTSNPETPWEEDGKLRIVAFLGKKLLNREEAKNYKFQVQYNGPAVNVDCNGDLSCGDIGGNANVQGALDCGDIGGNVTCAGNIHCGDIGGTVVCSGGILK
jgi:cytoskeletal protein CcmA (bactofilin family)